MNASDDDDGAEPDTLRDDAARMLGHWRDADSMPPAAHARVWRRLASPANSRPASGSARSGWTWAIALAAALVLAWWVSAWLRRDTERTHAEAFDAAVHTVDPQPPRVDSVVAAPLTHTTPAELPAVTPSPAPTPPGPAGEPLGTPPTKRPTTTPPAVMPAATPLPEPSSLTRERGLIERAWQALTDGDPATALLRAAEHGREFPTGVLAPERRAIVVIARCTRQDAGAAGQAAQWLAAEPGSVLARRVRAACSVP